MVPGADLVARFAGDLDRLSPNDERIGLAVSGGPDSLALLLLAAAARPGLIDAATVDHALRSEGRSEAEMVAAVCAGLGVPHRILTIDWNETPTTGLQEKAREARYRLLAGWMRDTGLDALCTGHHRDDQAETLLMRLARGSGVRGLAGMKPSASVPGAHDLKLLRPLLGWSRETLFAVCRETGVTAADDPSNNDATYERVRVRQWLASADMDAEALARSASNLRDADEAIDWIIEREWAEAVAVTKDFITYLPGDAPAEIRRRVVARIVATLATEGGTDLRGSELGRLMDMLQSEGSATPRGVLCKGGATWRFEPAPARSSSCG